MPTADESQQALRLITTRAVEDATAVAVSATGTPEARRLIMLNEIPGLISYYADGSAALAADTFDDERERVGAPGTYLSAVVVNDRTVKIRRAIAWAADPFFGAEGDVAARVGEVVQPEVARPYRDTILENSRRDPESIGWSRVAGDGCPFCRMAAAKGAVYKRDTANFAAHPNCDCTAVQVYRDGRRGPEASALQYIGAKRRRTAAEKARLRAYLDDY